jgi:hypothetical protein
VGWRHAGSIAPTAHSTTHVEKVRKTASFNALKTRCLLVAEPVHGM